MALAACAAERETTLSRSARMREGGELRVERQRLQQEMDVLQRSNAEAKDELVAKKREMVSTAAELRTTLVALQHEVEREHGAERDLAAAMVRRQQIEQELAPLRALEATLRDQERLHAEVGARVAATAAEIEALNRDAAAKDAELQPRLQALRQRVAALQQLGVTLASAEAAIAEAMKVIAPAPPAPATAPAPAPPAPAPPAKK